MLACLDSLSFCSGPGLRYSGRKKRKKKSPGEIFQRITFAFNKMRPPAAINHNAYIIIGVYNIDKELDTISAT